MVPVYNQDAEKAILGNCLLDKLVLLETREILTAADFYFEKHRYIFEKILELDDQKKTVDIITLQEIIEIDKIGGVPYLLSLVNQTPSIANNKQYIEIVKAKSIARQKIAECNETIKKLQDEEDPFEVISQSMVNDSKLIGDNRKSSIIHAKERVNKVYAQLEERRETNGIVGISTGFSDLDRKIGGLRDGLLILLAARPAMGKTTLALNIAKYTAFKIKKPTLFVSLEMTNDQLIEKMLAEDANLDSNILQNTMKLTDHDWKQLGNAAARIYNSQLYLDDTHRCKASELAIRLRRFKSLHDLGLVIIDYIQILAPERHGGRNAEVTETSGILQGLAKELNIPILALSQLSREVEKRPNKIPMLADLRESGSLEQDAAQVMFLYREDYYKPEDYPPNNDPSLTNLIIAKNRFGPLGVVDFHFHKAKSRFSLVEKIHQQKIA